MLGSREGTKRTARTATIRSDPDPAPVLVSPGTPGCRLPAGGRGGRRGGDRRPCSVGRAHRRPCYAPPRSGPGRWSTGHRPLHPVTPDRSARRYGATRPGAARRYPSGRPAPGPSTRRGTPSRPAAARPSLAGGPVRPRLPRRARRPRRSPGATAACGSCCALVGFVVGQIVASSPSRSSPRPGRAEQPARGSIATLAVPPEWYVVVVAGRPVGGVLRRPLAGQPRSGAPEHFVADLGLRFRWIDLAGIADRRRRPVPGRLALRARSSRTSTTSAAPPSKLTGASHGSGFVVIAVFTVVGAPFFEELFFRGLLLGPGPGRSPPRHRARSRGPRPGASARRWWSTACCSGWPTASWSSSPGWPCSACMLAIISVPHRAPRDEHGGPRHLQPGGRDRRAPQPRRRRSTEGAVTAAEAVSRVRRASPRRPDGRRPPPPVRGPRPPARPGRATPPGRGAPPA